jgi:hypothetical protein
MKTTNKENQELSDRLCNTLNKVEKQIYNNFKLYKRKNNKFRVCIEVDSKVNKIEALKDYLNTNFVDYNINISFAGGSFWGGYTTILSLEIVE